MKSAKSKSNWARSTRSLWAGFGLAITYADYALKQTVQAWLGANGGSYEVTPFFHLTSVYNAGAAFGFLANGGVLSLQLLTTISFAMCACVYGFLLVYPRMDMQKAFIAALLLGGGLGNAIDRLANNRVYDYLDFHLAGWHWPAFNLADIAITVSILLMVWTTFKPSPKSCAAPTDAGSDGAEAEKATSDDDPSLR